MIDEILDPRRNAAAATAPRRLRALTDGRAESRVDREKAIIRGFRLISVGEAKGHGAHIDEEFLLEVATAASGKRLKTRYTHPGMSADGLGSFLGWTHNVGVSADGLSVVGDLHLSKASFDGPRGNLGKYVLDLAESDPDAFGASIVFSPSDMYEFDGTSYFRLEKLHGVDLVDEPAAEQTLFGSDETAEAQAFAMLDAALLGEDVDVPVHPERLRILFSQWAAARGVVLAINKNVEGTMADEVKELTETIELSEETTVVAEAEAEEAQAEPDAVAEEVQLAEVVPATVPETIGFAQLAGRFAELVRTAGAPAEAALRALAEGLDEETFAAQLASARYAGTGSAMGAETPAEHWEDGSMGKHEFSKLVKGFTANGISYERAFALAKDSINRQGGLK
jgi:hypothetical protein